MRRGALIAIFALSLALASEAVGEPKGLDRGKPQTTQATQPTQSPPQPISVEQTLYLIRSTLMTLNDANRSGNYTVLRDLAAPAFQAKNSAADLAMIFMDLRRRNFDLFTTALAPPQLTAAPALDATGMLRLVGYFPTRPLQIQFDLSYQAVAGQWRLFAVSVATPEAPVLQAALGKDKAVPARSQAGVPKKP
jgi:hypothetical protein